ncbi:MAG: hypothetical protein OEZ57_00365 [Nitrospirota bacterium]|nr:hypothetical protein [Nitrospirota bacterium]MDH5586322.1 hypothetical protein [Nitrospirota bacterium]MDH5773352.1 hypothetical protein [Nitrospirota bacterium]
MINVYHIAGVDDRERGFNRQIQINGESGAFQARLRYEAVQIEVECVETEEQALQRLIAVLHERGYAQLRTQRIFQGEQYLGNQELWVDYLDPEPPEVPVVSWFMRIRQNLGIGKAKT